MRDDIPMPYCDELGTEIQLFIDNELIGEDLSQIQSHMENCEICQRSFKEQKALSSLVYDSRPLGTAPASLRERVLEINGDVYSQLGHESKRPSYLKIPESSKLAAALFIMTLSALLSSYLIDRAHAANLAETAI